MDFMSLSLAELEELEDVSGVPLGQLMGKLSSGEYTAKMLQGLSLVVNRRLDPDFSLADAREVSFDEAVSLLAGGDDDDSGKE